MTAVQQALERCFADLIEHDETQKVKVEYRQRYRTIVVEYTNRSGERELHPMYEMSDGYRSVLSMAADIAHRMAVLNPQLGDAILETPGVIIIDEVELHLHPGWQKRILKDLTSVFPNIQFIVSTHSPEVITGWMIYTVFSNKKSLRTTYSSNPSGEPCTRDLFCLWANRDWSSFAGLIMEVTGHADHSSGNFSPDSGRFLVSGPADRDAAVARAAKLFQKDPYWHSLFQPPKS